MVVPDRRNCLGCSNARVRHKTTSEDFNAKTGSDMARNLRLLSRQRAGRAGIAGDRLARRGRGDRRAARRAGHARFPRERDQRCRFAGTGAMDRASALACESRAMIKRREFLRTSATVTAAISLHRPALARPMPANFDIVEVGIVCGDPGLAAKLRIQSGTFLSPNQAMRPESNRLTALLSPGNAALLAEYVRFEHGINLDDQPFPAFGLPATLTVRPDARLVTVQWPA